MTKEKYEASSQRGSGATPRSEDLSGLKNILSGRSKDWKVIEE